MLDSCGISGGYLSGKCGFRIPVAGCGGGWYLGGMEWAGAGAFSCGLRRDCC